VYNPITRKVIRIRSVIFNEAWTPFPLSSLGELISLPVYHSNDSGEPLYSLIVFDDFEDEPFVRLPIVAPPSAIILARQLASEATLVLRRATNHRSRSERALSQTYDAPTFLAPTSALSIVEPCSFKKAMKSPGKAHWLLATEKEFSSLISKGTWHMVPFTSPVRVIGCSWKFKLKRDSSGSIVKYKARLVARGDMQHLDFATGFAPTVRYTTLRVLLVLACHYDLETDQMDVVSAFQHADIVSDIFMEQPEGYHTPSATSTRLVCKIDKALFGIREAPRAWNTLLSSWLLSFGFSQSNVDPTIFTITSNRRLYVLAIYVDDCILVGRSGPFIYNFKSAFSTRFDIEDLGPASWVLDFCIVRDRTARTLTLSQSQHAEDILKKFGMAT
jgi:hypothetical protein